MRANMERKAFAPTFMLVSTGCGFNAVNDQICEQEYVYDDLPQWTGAVMYGSEEAHFLPRNDAIENQDAVSTEG